MAFNDALAHLLEERRIATLVTQSADGLPHVTAVWFLYEDGVIYIATGRNTGKVSNLKRDPRMAVCVESRESGREAGMSACGEAELLAGVAATSIAKRINGKYLTDDALAHPVIGPAFEQMSDVVIKLAPERWISWDMEAVGSQLFEGDASTWFKPTLK
jgi:PPOX class probable F420-dependent enzyme